jgi:hypothetical protein
MAARYVTPRSAAVEAPLNWRQIVRSPRSPPVLQRSPTLVTLEGRTVPAT